MILLQSTEFKKKFKKTSLKIKARIEEKLLIFEENSNDPVLSIHPLNGDYIGCKSMDVTGDIRLIFREVRKDVYILIRFGTHHELYGN